MEINKVPYETSSLAEIKIIKFFPSISTKKNRLRICCKVVLQIRIEKIPSNHQNPLSFKGAKVTR